MTSMPPSEQVVLRTIAYSFVREVIVYVGAEVSPSREDWSRYMDFIRRWKQHGSKSLVYEQGGAPDAVQRRQMHETTGDVQNTVAVLTASVVGRGIVGLLSWVRPGYRAFVPHDEIGAIMHLGLRGRAADEVLAELAVLRRRLRDRI